MVDIGAALDSTTPALRVQEVRWHQPQWVFGIRHEISQWLHLVFTLEAAHCPPYPHLALLLQLVDHVGGNEA